MREEREFEFLAILNALILPFSITGAYIPLTLALILGILKGFKLPKDFFAIIILYVWRLVSLVFNGKNPLEIKDIYDKFGYPVFSNSRVSSFRVLASFAISISTLVILSFFLDNLYGEFGEFRGFYGHKHHIASLFSFSSIAFLAYSLFKNWIFVLPFSLSLYGLIITKAYAYIYFTFLALLFIFLMRYDLLRNFLHVLLATFPVILVLYLHSDLSPKLIWSFSKRIEFWKIGLELWKESPILGIGYSQVSEFLIPYFERGILDNYSHVHNVYLNALAETGIFGFLIVLCITIYFPLKYIYKYRKTKETLSLILALTWIVYTLGGFFETNFDTAVLNLTLYLFMGIFEGEIRERI